MTVSKTARTAGTLAGLAIAVLLAAPRAVTATQAEPRERGQRQDRQSWEELVDRLIRALPDLGSLEQLGRDLRLALPPFDEIEVEVRLRPARLGMTVQELQPQLAEYFGVDGGLLVTRVDPDSPAAGAGIRAGDVIQSIDGAAVADRHDLRRRVSRLSPGDEVAIGIVREKQEMTLRGRIEERPARVRGWRWPV